MMAEMEPMLYIDPQRQIPAGFCRFCGGELYRPSLRCCRCREEEK